MAISITGVIGGVEIGAGGSIPGRVLFRAQTDGDGSFPTMTYLRLPAPGDGAGIQARIWGLEHGTMNRGFFRIQEGSFVRNSIGSAPDFSFSFNPGYTDELTLPWSTGGIPASWGADAFWQDGNDLQIILGSNDGRTIDWVVHLQVYLFGTAQLLL